MNPDLLNYCIVALVVFSIGRAAMLLMEEDHPYLTLYLLFAAVVWPVTILLALFFAVFGLYLNLDNE